MNFQDIAKKYEDINFLDQRVIELGKKENSQILVLLDISPLGVMVKEKLGDYKYRVELLGSDKTEKFADSFVKKDSKISGLIKKDKDEKLFAEIFDKKDTEFGDLLEVCDNRVIDGDNLYGNNLETSVPLFIGESLKDAADVRIVNKTLWGESGLKEMVRCINPKYLFMVSLINETENCKSSKGVVITVKDGNAVVSKDMIEKLEEIAERENIDTQLYVGKESDLLEKVSLVGTNSKFCQICVPVAYKNEKISKINLKDIEKTVKLLLKTVCEL